MSRIYFKVPAGDIRKAVREKGTKKIIALSKNPNVLRQIAKRAIDILEPFVPVDSGALRKSAHVIYHEKQIQIVWGDNTVGSNGAPTHKYAHYQYEGKVYGPNIPILIDGEIVAWRSPKRKSKYLTGRRLKYSSPTARSHWTNEIKRGTPGFEKLIEYAEPLMKKEVKK